MLAAHLTEFIGEFLLVLVGCCRLQIMSGLYAARGLHV